MWRRRYAVSSVVGLIAGLRECGRGNAVGGLAGWDQAGQQHRMAQPHVAIMCIGIRFAVKDMSPVQHVPLRSGNVMAHLSRVLERVREVARAGGGVDDDHGLRLTRSRARKQVGEVVVDHSPQVLRVWSPRWSPGRCHQRRTTSPSR